MTGPLPHPRDLVKPRLRGWLHFYAFFVSVAAGAVLVAVARTGRPRLSVTVYAVSIALLFGTSALYHRRTWQPRARALMKRLDHSMIFVFIAGTYTPFAVLLLSGTTARVVLAVIWGGAVLGIGLRMAWLHSPRWLAVPLYIGLGWVAVFVLPGILHRGGVAALVLLLLGGALYTAGAVVYAARRPDPRPASFGYHEVFHAFTLVAAACHYAAIVVGLHAVSALA